MGTAKEKEEEREAKEETGETQGYRRAMQGVGVAC